MVLLTLLLDGLGVGLLSSVEIAICVGLLVCLVTGRLVVVIKIASSVEGGRLAIGLGFGFVFGLGLLLAGAGLVFGLDAVSSVKTDAGVLSSFETGVLALLSSFEVGVPGRGLDIVLVGRLFVTCPGEGAGFVFEFVVRPLKLVGLLLIVC